VKLSCGETGPAAEIAAWWRLVELCLPSHDSCGAVTFQPAGSPSLEADWDSWCRTIFHPALRPSVFVLLEAAAARDASARAAADRRLGSALPEAVATASLAAGRRILLEYIPPCGARLLERLSTTAGEDASFGHLATVFCVRAHVFHLPAVQTAGALLLAECVLGAESAGLTLSAARSAALLERASQPVPEAPAWQVLAV
jgi:hypothetical protein